MPSSLIAQLKARADCTPTCRARVTRKEEVRHSGGHLLQMNTYVLIHEGKRLEMAFPLMADENAVLAGLAREFTELAHHLPEPPAAREEAAGA